MDIDKFQQVNVQRAARWHKDIKDWTLLEWAGAMAGEAGEGCNVAKKIRRLDLQLPNKEAGLDKNDVVLLNHKLACEVADTIIYGLIILSIIDYNASEIIKSVFDQKSIEYGFPERA